jgi:hypothetical protein
MTPERTLLSLELEDKALARMARLTEDDAREACRAFFYETRESVLPRVRLASGEKIHALLEELRTDRFALEARSQIDAGDACRRELLEGFITALAPFEVAPIAPAVTPVAEKRPARGRKAEPPAPAPTPLPTPWDGAKDRLAALEAEHAPLAAEWAALRRELGPEIDATGILARLRLSQERLTETNAAAEELRVLKQTLLCDFGTHDPARLAEKQGAPAVAGTLRAELHEARKALGEANTKLRAIETEFGETNPIKIMQSIRRLRDELAAKDREQASFISERAILAREFQGLDAGRIVTQNRILKERIAEVMEANRSLEEELTPLRAERERLRHESGCESIDEILRRFQRPAEGETSLRDLEALLGDAESALSALSIK